MKKAVTPYTIQSITELHRLLQLGKPEHPLVSVIKFEDTMCFDDESLRSVAYNFYCIALKKNFHGKMRYGQQYYDFDEGIMTFFSPGQVITTDINPEMKISGWWLVVHPDFLRNYTLSKTIKDYGYFSYAVNEALHLSEKEEISIDSIMENIKGEYASVIDHYSQDVIISYIELLLNYCNRFYNRQFITRKSVNSDLLVEVEKLLSNYFNSEKVQESGLPTVAYLSEQLHLSPNYLSDMLRSLTGQSTQQHIHAALIEKAKEILTTTSLSVSEIAYRLGFEYPQSFNKLFKSKTNVSPLQFRTSYS
ncbi:helix-turn-helix domain-containing protein [Flavobacterium kingsejongi]|uniref:AraC family transcriptional regulator n=1 Tax=Flavobacterium kingsejongi TaxID=1678728 RepID=A0A2S1LQT9_9FLAO|nr:helix-turn-helix transcriptional regulator [Flavobacterium kingsejongi]AWG26058.1 AraC family transcriptional regulator [Flavobacterium kingsejongi]